MRYSKLEDSIKTRLASLAALGFDVEVLPDTESKHKKPTNKPRISILYESSEFSPEVVRGVPNTLSTNEAVLTEYATLAIVYRARTLRGPKGLHTVADHSRRLLMGYKPDGWRRILPKSYTFTEFESGIWVYTMHIVCTALVVQDEPDEPIDGLPLLQETTFEIEC